MKCPYCAHDQDKVVDSRPTDEGTAVRRRRECLSCGSRFTTYEKIESYPLIVIKRHGEREPFDLDKIIMGMTKACEKRTISAATIDRAAKEIENTIRNSLKREVSSDEVGELVMEQLKMIDQVAYVRFASVYREFKDVESFLAELQTLLGKTDHGVDAFESSDEISSQSQMEENDDTE
jgi:transcriptional repressor NrdR